MRRLAPNTFFVCLVVMTLALALGGCGPKAPAGPVVDQILAPGMYKGVIWSAGRDIPINTEFYVAPGGDLAGRYLAYDKGGDVPGVLGECRVVKDRTLACWWRDKYGGGPMQIEFSSDYSSFIGQWGVLGLKKRHHWSGTRDNGQTLVPGMQTTSTGG